MPQDRTTTSYALLGLLSVRDWTTYELAKQVQRSLNWFWPRAERKLYDEPKRLVADGLATATRQHTGQRARTVYRITRSGRAALRQWLGEPPAARSVEFEGMVKVFFADAGSKEQLLATLECIKQEADARLTSLSEMASSEPTPFPHRRHLSALTLKMHHEQEQALRRWAQWATKQVASWHTADDPGAWDSERVLREIAGSAAPSAPA